MKAWAWLPYALVATALWGFWGFGGKLAARSVNSPTLLVLASLGGLSALPVYLFLFRKQLSVSLATADPLLAVLAGVAGSIGGLFYYLALSRGEASRVVVITATYPVVTVILAYFFLNEALSVWKILGVVLALAGVCLLAV